MLKFCKISKGSAKFQLWVDMYMVYKECGDVQSVNPSSCCRAINCDSNATGVIQCIVNPSIHPINPSAIIRIPAKREEL